MTFESSLIVIAPRSQSTVDLYWLPLGAGGHSVRVNGRIYEAIAAFWQRRPRLDLYHAALSLQLHGTSYVIELAPALPDAEARRRGLVAEGAVGSRFAGRLRLFRYQLRCWRDGIIPDVAEAVASPVSLSLSSEEAQHIIEAAPHVPTFVWGRDELGAGDMWNSNSVVSWLLAQAGIDPDVSPPPNGRAPGWRAGIVAAQRGMTRDSRSAGD